MNNTNTNIGLKTKLQSTCTNLFRDKNEIDSKISTLLKNIPLWSKTEEGEMVKTHPWVSTFGAGKQQCIFSLDAHTAEHILNNFNNIDHEDPSQSRRNRTKNLPNIKRFSKDMRAGNWEISAPIVFEEGTGALLDGQNRLHALVMVAREVCPKDISQFSIDFSIIFGADRSIQDYIDKGAKRTLIAQAKIKNLISDRDTNGNKALHILQGHLQKISEGNGFDTSQCNDTDVFEHWGQLYPNMDMTYEDICRYVAQMTDFNRSAYEFQLGHQVCLAQGLMVNKEDTELFIECITAENESLEDLRNKGIDVTFGTDEFSSVRVCRGYLKRIASAKKKFGSNGGSVKPIHYGHMLYFLTQFFGRKTTASAIIRELSFDPKKLSKAKYVSLFPVEDVEDPIEKILNLS